FGRGFHCRSYLYDDLGDPFELSFLNLAAAISNTMVFVRLFARYPTQCTMRTAELAARRGSLGIVLFLSKHAPQVIAESVVSNAIEGHCVLELLEHLLLHHPACRNPLVHLAVATRSRKSFVRQNERTAVVRLLLEHGWDGKCPSDAMMNACKIGDADVLSMFTEKANVQDAAWRTSLEECCNFLEKRKKLPKNMKDVVARAKKLLDGTPTQL
ncbi:hypothetical protein HDU96_003840, partial [Phlyctochytrium bullatum]